MSSGWKGIATVLSRNMEAPESSIFRRSVTAPDITMAGRRHIGYTGCRDSPNRYLVRSAGSDSARFDFAGSGFAGSDSARFGFAGSGSADSDSARFGFAGSGSADSGSAHFDFADLDFAGFAD